MKKLTAFMLAAVLLLAAMLPAAAAVVVPQIRTEYGYSFTVTSDGQTDRLNILRYTPEDEKIYIPEELGGIAVTPDDVFPALFTGCTEQQAFLVDDDNEYFSVADGVLFSKDGKNLLAYPCGKTDTHYTVPKRVECIAADIGFTCSSLTVNAPDCVIGDNSLFASSVILCGIKGSAADKTAEANGYPFILLGEGHEHTYINLIEQAATCVTDGRILSYCPCEQIAAKTTTVPATGEHSYTYMYPLGTYVCIHCGERRSVSPGVIDDDDEYISEDECTCVCHADEHIDTSSLSSIIDCILYRIKLLFWRLTHTHTYCECGRRHY